MTESAKAGEQRTIHSSEVDDSAVIDTTNAIEPVAQTHSTPRRLLARELHHDRYEPRPEGPKVAATLLSGSSSANSTSPDVASLTVTNASQPATPTSLKAGDDDLNVSNVALRAPSSAFSPPPRDLPFPATWPPTAPSSLYRSTTAKRETQKTHSTLYELTKKATRPRNAPCPQAVRVVRPADRGPVQAPAPSPPTGTPTPLSNESKTLSPETTTSETLIDAGAEAMGEVGSQAFGVILDAEQQEHDVAWAGAQFHERDELS